MDICKSELCSGCSLCADICPFDAVAMVTDGEGFLRPVIDEEKCRSCGLCQKKCPVNNGIWTAPDAAYAAYSKDREIRKRSSSGGLFAHLAKCVLEAGGVVFGATYDSDFSVVHKECEDMSSLRSFMGSKYVQSNTVGVYRKVQKYLENGRKVLFSGTPCQCAALKNLVGEREELVLCDFICHGVPSPAVWKKYLDCYRDVVGASFRDKALGWEEFSMRIDTKTGKYSASQYKDPYMRLFLTNKILRPSCYRCSWKGEHYSSDITLADFWGISKVFPHMNDDKGTSVVIVRSSRGAALIDSIKDSLVMEKTDIGVISRINTAYAKSVEVPAQREKLFESLTRGESFKELSEKYVKELPKGEVLKIRIKRKIKKAIGKVYRLKKR